MLENIAMNQSTHRNDSLVHSHIATLQFVFFFQRLALFLTPSIIASEPDVSAMPWALE